MPPAPLLCLSAHHTGTWFVLDAIRNHPDVPVVLRELAPFLVDCPEGEGCRSGGPWIPEDGQVSLFHVHYAPRMGSLIWDYPTGTRLPNLKWILPTLAMGMVAEWKTVIPVRDPVLSLLTMASRHPERDPVWVPLAFEELLALGGHANALLFPVDLLAGRGTGTPVSDRFDSLERLFKHFGMLTKSGGEYEYLTRLSIDWEPPAYNVTPDSPLKQGYRRRDPTALMGLQQLFPRAMNELYGRRPALRAGMERLGYRDLLWWE